jgi:membrane protease YdiL (CAAX protease family)
MIANPSFLERYSLLAFLILTPLLTFAVVLLPLPAEVLPMIMVLIPAVLAVLLASITGGRKGAGTLLREMFQWRVRFGWYAVALALALVIRLAMSVLALLLGWIPAIQLRPWPGAQFALLGAILLISASLEGLGWRAYALPKLMERRPALFSALLLGILWGSVHIPLHFPGMIYAEAPWIATVLELVALSVILVWLYVQTRGNVLITVLFHAAQSFFVVVNEGIPLGQQSWLMVMVYGAVALVLAVVYGPNLQREPLRETAAVEQAG